MDIRYLFVSPGHNYRGHHGGPAGEHSILEMQSIECVAGRGIVGDRYFDYKPDFKGQITFFEWENLVRMWEELNVPSVQRIPSATRRNVITEGVNLCSLIDQEFEIQGVRFLGTEECRPCYWMNGAIHPQAEEWMRGRGGLRAKILGSGVLRVTRMAKENCFVSTLMAGGKSTRMGCDKAKVEVAAQPLWERQLALLRALGGAVSVSAGERPDWLPEDVEWVRDVQGVEGPLAGLVAALEWAQQKAASHLVVLAVDLPRMRAEVLDSLLASCGNGVGIVPTIESHLEPLAAIYPIECVGEFRAASLEGRWKLQDVAAELVERGLLKAYPITEVAAFHNMNTPEDIPKI